MAEENVVGVVDTVEQGVSDNVEVEHGVDIGVESTNVVAGQTDEVPEPVDLNLIDIDEISDPLVKNLHRQITSRFPNLDFNQAIGDAFEFGGKEYINQYYLQEVAGEAAPILQRQLETIYDIREAYVTDLVSGAHKEAGSEQAWNQALNAFKGKAPKHVQAVVKGLVDSVNPDSHQEAIKYIVEFAKSNGYVDRPVNTVKGSTNTAGPTMSHSEYLTAMAEAQKIGNPDKRQAKKLELTKRRYGR